MTIDAQLDAIYTRIAQTHLGIDTLDVAIDSA